MLHEISRYVPTCANTYVYEKIETEIIRWSDNAPLKSNTLKSTNKGKLVSALPLYVLIVSCTVELYKNNSTVGSESHNHVTKTNQKKKRKKEKLTDVFTFCISRVYIRFIYSVPELNTFESAHKKRNAVGGILNRPEKIQNVRMWKVVPTRINHKLLTDAHETTKIERVNWDSGAGCCKMVLVCWLLYQCSPCPCTETTHEK